MALGGDGSGGADGQHDGAILGPAARRGRAVRDEERHALGAGLRELRRGGEATGDSDIDVLVDLGEARTKSLFGLMSHIYELTGKRPDVYDVSELRPGPFRDEVMREAVPL